MARAYFALISLVVLALGGVAAYRDATPEWKGYQEHYFQRLASLEPDLKRSQEILNTSPTVKQFYDEDTRIVDRCTTCHLGYTDPRFASEPQPLRTHSGDVIKRHPSEKVPCTICHDGNGYATSVEAAHGHEEYAAKPLLTGVWIQSRCVRCHPDGNVKGAEHLQRGLALLQRVACFACHEVPHVPARSYIGPDLDGIKHKVRPRWLVAWLMDPTAYSQATLMPRFYLDKRQALAITAYLMTLDGPALLSDGDAAGATPDVEAGENIFEQAACTSCHVAGNKGGSKHAVGPPLSHIGNKVQASWLASWVRAPRRFQPRAAMPSYGFSAPEAAALAAYLTRTFATPVKNENVNSLRLASELARKDLAAEGQSLVVELGCTACHHVGGKLSTTKIGPDLSDVGDSDVHHLAWGDVEHAEGMGLRDYLRIKLATPRAFGKTAKMPKLNLTSQDIEDVVVALMSFADSPLPEQAEVAKQATKQQPAAMPAGKVGRVFKRYQCLTCHQLRKRFGHLAPDLSFEGDKVKKPWLLDYLRSAYAIRPASKAQMPKLQMQESEVNLVADFISAAWTDDRVPEDPFHGEPPPSELIEKGKQKYNSTFTCTDCHSIEGEEADTAPKLAGVGLRLRPGWVYQWLLDPQRFYENEMTVEDMSDEDAKALTAYLMSLK